MWFNNPGKHQRRNKQKKKKKKKKKKPQKTKKKKKKKKKKKQFAVALIKCFFAPLAKINIFRISEKS